MQGNSKDQESNVVRVELKYCEHCGGLWLRECGAGVVYCSTCQPKVADLPVPKKKPQRVILPVRRRTVVENYGAEEKRSETDLEAAGGAA
jgi:Zn-finger nucleic acid-binding protein